LLDLSFLSIHHPLRATPRQAWHGGDIGSRFPNPLVIVVTDTTSSSALKPKACDFFKKKLLQMR
jgi:hypothetical protein